MDRIKMLTLLALRTMVSHRVKNTIVGSIMIFGTMLVVVGTSLLDSIKSSMQKSITSSITGDAQIFSSTAEDKLAIFGQMGAGNDIGEIEDFTKVSAKLKAMPNVKAVVPMALGNAASFGKSELDRVLLDLRKAAKENDRPMLAQKEAHVRQIAALMLQENTNAAEISTDTEKVAEERTQILRVLEDDFWTGFADAPETQLEYLDTKLAPLSTEGRMLYVRYIATDPELFVKSFDRFQVVDGEMIPEGKRGILFSKRYYEMQVKNRVARELDAIKKEVDEGGVIATDEVLKNRIDRLSRLSALVVFQLDAAETPVALEKLRTALPGAKGGIDAMMTEFLKVDDKTLNDRYAYFYKEIAPMIDVYDIKVGDEMVLQSFTKTGYAKSVKVKIWGTFNFRGLETSDLAGSTNIMDLVTFRALYGKMTVEQREELSDIKAEAGVTAVTAENAEDALFGGDADLESVADFKDATVDVVIERDKNLVAQFESYEPQDLQQGVVLNAAVILKDPSGLTSFIDQISEMKDLGIQAIDWQEASGMVGQFILVIELVLYTAIFIIFLVALVIINNSMVMATMERIPEIGTMRAIGAQKSTIMLMTLLETSALCVIAGAIGAGLGAGLIGWLGVVGIKAPNDVMVFLFGGPELYPTFTAGNLFLGAFIILIVSLISTLYPAIVATRVQPVVAMRGKD